jgi:translation initiation factor IF-3
VNEEIRVPQVRLIDQDGEMQGVMTAREAILRAYSVGLDLLEISPNAEPPVVKILDFGKFKYEEQKKKNEARKKQKVIEIKEIKLRPTIDDNDYKIKMKAMTRFLEEGDKVKVTLRFRGRELAHQDLGMAVLVRVRDDLDPIENGRPPDGYGGRAEVTAGLGSTWARLASWRPLLYKPAFASRPGPHGHARPAFDHPSLGDIKCPR